MKKKCVRCLKHFTTPSLTKQAFKDECDANILVERFREVHGFDLSASTVASGGQYGDFSNITDYRSALDQIAIAEDSFMQLPAVVRSRFDNDPGYFLDFTSNPENEDEMIKMGLIAPKKPAFKDVQTTSKSDENTPDSTME